MRLCRQHPNEIVISWFRRSIVFAMVHNIQRQGWVYPAKGRFALVVMLSCELPLRVYALTSSRTRLCLSCKWKHEREYSWGATAYTGSEPFAALPICTETDPLHATSQKTQVVTVEKRLHARFGGADINSSTLILEVSVYKKAHSLLYHPGARRPYFLSPMCPAC